MMKKATVLFAALCLLCMGCGTPPAEENLTADASWPELEQAARGQSLTLMMWQGDPLINRYMSDFVVPALKAQHGITLNIVDGQGNAIVSTLMAEMEAGQRSSQIDMLWINGETFYQLRQINALYGPFTDKLPNARYIDWDNPFIGYDFQQPVEGYECPWGNVQMALIYNAEKVAAPPMTLEELEVWVKANPGKFTIGNDFTGMTLLKSWLTHLAGGKGALDGPFDEAKYQAHSRQMWDYLKRLKPYLWNKGQSFPSSVAQMHQLYANGELWLTMSNNDSEVDNKISQGIFPDYSRAYVPDFGTIQNAHYLGIVQHSAQKAAAMVVCNFLISPAAQLEKLRPNVWGDGTVLSLGKLPPEWQAAFADVPGRKYAPVRADIQDKAIMEPAPEYMIRLFDDFRTEVMTQ